MLKKFKATEKDVGQELGLEGFSRPLIGGVYEKKTLLTIKDSNGFLAQLLLTPKQLERLHKWLGQRLTELL